ncbi:MAG: hypothetical protein NDI84_10820, partial [Steroidobacteraceae bacterium]|nr:hypothetical protein [Steroidobacteraceae bacterium]
MTKQSHAGAIAAGERLTSHLNSHRRTALSLAIAVALGLPVVGYGQEAPPPPPAEAELEEVVVTGIRAGIE